MRLYHTPGASSLAVIIVICELGIDCEYERVDLKSKKTATGKDYLIINAKGTVPALVLANDVVLTESGIIQKYLAEKHAARELLPEIEDFNHYRVLEWLNFINNDLHKGCFAALYNELLDIQVKNDIFKPILFKKLSVLDQALKENEFLLGKNFTLADASLFVILTWLFDLKIDFSEQTNLTRYFNTVKQRPSILAALKRESE